MGGDNLDVRNLIWAMNVVLYAGGVIAIIAASFTGTMSYLIGAVWALGLGWAKSNIERVNYGRGIVIQFRLGIPWSVRSQ